MRARIGIRRVRRLKFPPNPHRLGTAQPTFSIRFRLQAIRTEQRTAFKSECEIVDYEGCGYYYATDTKQAHSPRQHKGDRARQDPWRSRNRGRKQSSNQSRRAKEINHIADK